MITTDNIINKIILSKCEDILPSLKDKSIKLVFTDPPYGIFKNLNNDNLINQGKYATTEWDIKPEKKVFEQIMRVSENQIIFGGEHLSHLLPQSRGWIVWDKKKTGNNFADCELAWTSFDKPIKKLEHEWNGFLVKTTEKRYHPTQKPLQLCIEIIELYTKEGDLVLDCYCRSGTIPLACKMTNRKFIGIEMSKEYAEISCQRLQQKTLLDTNQEIIDYLIIPEKETEIKEDTEMEQKIRLKIEEMGGMVSREGAIKMLMNEIKNQSEGN